MQRPPNPKIVTIQEKPSNFEVVGKKIEEAISTKQLKKDTISSEKPNFNYTFQKDELFEKHATSGGFKIPQGNYGKNFPIKKEDERKELKENISDRENLSKIEMFNKIGIGLPSKAETFQQDVHENEFLELEPYTNYELYETLKTKKDIADKVIDNLERSIEKIKRQRETLKTVN